MKKIVILILIVFVGIYGAERNLNMEDLKGKINEITTKDKFSGVISIYNLSEKKAILEKTYGYRNRAEILPNQIDTKFGIASGTKTFTALGIAKLIEMGKLKESDKLADLLKFDLSGLDKNVAIEQLLTHTSGIYDYADEELIEDFDNFHLEIPWFQLNDVKEYLPLLTGKPMKFKAGEKFSYSNSGYVWLALVIQEVSGKKYQDFIKEEILQPAGMQNSGFYYLNKLPENTATGYILTKEGIQTNIYNLPIIGGGDGGMFTTAEDLKTFWQKLLAGEIISLDYLETMLKPLNNVGYRDPNIFYGKGIWYHKNLNDNPMPYLLGVDCGVCFTSELVTYNKEKYVVTILDNLPGDGFWNLKEEINKSFKNSNN